MNEMRATRDYRPAQVSVTQPAPLLELRKYLSAV